MKLTKKYLKKIIKEELEKSIGDFGDDEGLPPEFYEKVEKLVRAKKDDASIHNAMQSSEFWEITGDAEVRKAIARAKEKIRREEEDKLEEVASAFRDLYKSIYNFKPKVDNTATIEDLERKIKNLMDKQEAQRFDELVRYAKENPPSSDDPDDMRYE